MCRVKDNRTVYVYRHRRLDNNSIFYIGIAVIQERPFSKLGRNKYWHNIVNKVGYITEIIYTLNDWVEACELECLLISEYGRKDLSTGILVNMTDGGDGAFGTLVTDETKLKMSLAHKNKIVSKETCLKISIGKKGNPHSLEGKKKKVKALGKKVIDTSNGKIYESITEVAKVFNSSPGVISRYLNGVRNNKTNLKFLIDK